MSLFSLAGKLRLAASKLKCAVVNLICDNGICCGGEWHENGTGQCCGGVWYGSDEDGDCCGDVWYPAENPCPSGMVYLRWGPLDNCCGCVPEQILDPRVGGYVDAEIVKDDLCCPLCAGGSFLPYDISGSFVGCHGACCQGIESCENTTAQNCQSVFIAGACCETGPCPILCCWEDSSGTSYCEIQPPETCFQTLGGVLVLGCETGLTGCTGYCCVDGEPQGPMSQSACGAAGGKWQGVLALNGSTSCVSGCDCRPPFDCACCQNVTSTAAGLIFTQPRSRRDPPFTDTFRVTVSGHTESSIYIHGFPVGASCDFEVTFVLCGESFSIDPVECGSNFKKLDVKVCWSEEHIDIETLVIQGCETGTILAGSCRPDGCNGGGGCTPGSECTTNLLHDDEGATADAAISVYGPVIINSSGTGPLVLTGDITIQPEACSLTVFLNGTNTDLNRIDGDILQTDSNKTVIVEKRGTGTWALAGTNTYRGQLKVFNGTLVITSDVDSNYGTGGSPFGLTPGSSSYPAIGGTDFVAGGTASLLFADGVTIERAFNVIAGSQNVVIGGYSGTSSVASSVTNTLYDDVTFQAASGATVTFSCLWIASGVDPIITVGTIGNTGTVVFDNYLPGPTQGTGDTSELRIEYGTAELAGADDRIDPTTPVTISGATLNIDGVSQSLDSLSFVATGGTVTGGTLRPVAVNVDGTSHEIESAVSLAQAATFTIEDDADLTVSGVISGAFAIAKDGDGLLELDAANTYSGGTTINGGTAKAGDVAAFGTGGITVNAGGTLDKSGFALANTITNNGGTVIP